MTLSNNRVIASESRNSRFVSTLGGAILLAASVCLGQSNSTPTTRTVYPVSIVLLSRVVFPTSPERKGFTVDVAQDAQYSSDDFPDDHLILTVYADKTALKPLAQLKFTSSYGFFDLSLVDVVGDGEGEFLLTTGEGHGTDVRAETLTVYRRLGKTFQAILRTPISSYFGVDQWWYKPEFTDVNGDGIIDLKLTLDHDPYQGYSVDVPSQIPKTKLKKFVYDRAKGRMLLYRPQ